MDMQIKQKFIELWKKYFNDAELPITFYYTDEEGHAELVKPGAGCATIVQYPFLEKDSDNPRGVLGTFDVSARPYVPENMLTISITIIENMEESFLITESWKKVQRRITAARK